MRIWGSFYRWNVGSETFTNQKHFNCAFCYMSKSMKWLCTWLWWLMNLPQPAESLFWISALFKLQAGLKPSERVLIFTGCLSGNKLKLFERIQEEYFLLTFCNLFEMLEEDGLTIWIRFPLHKIYLPPRGFTYIT